ncbi:hypothetical protein CGH80_22925 [Vibrio parahaemolyticus]|uniref:hypothetical protein n=3 Tax=Vibrio parahaemolyticus TaxID=670 RepID=UPI00084BB51A|nr:hypothetical protein [Vibrio parahaemolyticus]MBE3873304.1 hypothetical protein [Vibrio parahaemolyticus]MDF4985728.1 hypothetical protein [Vibrio parahaemolyticus]OEA23889.1 hypothetical protein BBM55_03820 [Vibrio parahaemolyticus]TOM29654.1 hypothetical protein CGH80_22925 [Vibrio parahaemolyticus]HBC3945988.1 hypothetical protein [Vibrio parahaemolyticus]
MVITPRVVCETCDTKHLLKVTIGREDSQYHSFPCTECEEEMEFGLENLFSVSDVKYRYGKNCKKGEFDYFEAIQVHLNPDFGVGHKVVKAGDIFTAILSNCLEMERMHEEMQQEKSEGIIEHRTNYDNYNSETMRFYLKVWSLLRKGKVELADKYILKNVGEFEESTGKGQGYYTGEFLKYIIGSYGLEVYENLKLEQEKAGDLKELVNFSADQNVDTYDIFEEFIGLFSEFSQVFTYLNRGLEISGNVKVSSTDFNRTKKYYSSAYEVLAKLLYIPAGINNSIERGDPHKFERLDSLTKYVKTGNGDKLRCLNDNHNLMKISECYDNHLRNASFHNNMNYSPKKTKITYKQNNGTDVKMNYKEYLIMCIKVTEAIAALSLFNLVELKES